MLRLSSYTGILYWDHLPQDSLSSVSNSILLEGKRGVTKGDGLFAVHLTGSRLAWDMSCRVYAWGIVLITFIEVGRHATVPASSLQMQWDSGSCCSGFPHHDGLSPASVNGNKPPALKLPLSDYCVAVTGKEWNKSIEELFLKTFTNTLSWLKGKAYPFRECAFTWHCSHHM